MTPYTYLTTANVEQLQAELEAVPVPGLVGCVFAEGDTDKVVVYTDPALSAADETALDASVAAHVPATAKVLVIAPLIAPSDVGRDVTTLDYRSGLLATLHKVDTRWRGEIQQVDYYLDETLADKGITIEVYKEAALTNLGYARTVNGLAVERWTKRTWWNTDGSVGATKVTHKLYSHDAVKQMKEGRRRRKNVIDKLSVDVLNMLVVTEHAVDPLAPTLAEIQAAELAGSTFMEAYSDQISTYLRTGALGWTGTPGVGDDSTAWLDNDFDGTPTIQAIAAAQGWTGTIRTMIQGYLVDIMAP